MPKQQHAYRAIGGAFALADGQNLSLLALFNAADSPFLLRVDRAYVLTASLSAVTGVGIELDVERISALTESGGSAGVLRPMDLNAPQQWPEIGQYVRVYHGGTATGAGIFAYRPVNNDEIALTGQEPWSFQPLWEACPGKYNDGALLLKAGQGVNVEQVTNSTAGAWVVGYDFRIERTKGG